MEKNKKTMMKYIWICAIGLLFAGVIFGTIINESIIYWIAMVGIAIAWMISEIIIEKNGRTNDDPAGKNK